MAYFERSFDKYSYIFRKEVKDASDSTIGYFFILSDPKRYKSDALIPELFKQSGNWYRNTVQFILMASMIHSGWSTIITIILSPLNCNQSRSRVMSSGC